MDYSVIIRRLVMPPVRFVGKIALFALVVFLLGFVYYIVRLRINPFKMNRKRLISLDIKLPLADFFRWKLVDMIDRKVKAREFAEYGFTIFCGRQGAGKTVSLVHYLERMRKCYPDCLIVTNFAYAGATHRMDSWRDFFEIRNGKEGVIFAIDEIHSEYSSAAWKDFPEDLLSEISQQRKQRIKIVATSQVFSRVAKQLREQAFSVILCRTYFGRWTFNREYDAADYELFCNSTAKGEKLRSFFRTSFVQSDALRSCYAAKELGFKKSSVKNFISVFLEFSDEEKGVHKCFLKDGYEKFKYSQLCEMLSLSEKERKKINPGMSVREIRQAKKSASCVGQTSGQCDNVIHFRSIEYTVRLPDDIAKRLDDYAASSGYSYDSIISSALDVYLVSLFDALKESSV